MLRCQTFSSSSVLKWLAFAVASLGLLGSACKAQPNNLEADGAGWTLVVLPELGPPPEELLTTGEVIPWPLDIWEPLTVRYRAYRLEGEQMIPVDVTALAQWDIEPAGAGSVMAPGVVSYAPEATFVIRVTFNGQTVRQRIVGASLQSCLDAQIQGRAAPTDITQSAIATLDKLISIDASVPTLGIIRSQLVSSGAYIADGGEGFGGEGLYLPNFIHNLANGAWTTRPTILIGPDRAADLVAGIATVPAELPINGQLYIVGEEPSPALLTLAHESLHQMADDMSLGEVDNDAPGDPWASVFEYWEVQVLSKTWLIRTSKKPTTEWERWLIAQWLNWIKGWYRTYYNDQPNDSAEKKERKKGLRKLIDNAGGRDGDGNGIPDTIDQQFRRWDIDPSTLPTTPPSGEPPFRKKTSQ